jgi:hypothetical protein
MKPQQRNAGIVTVGVVAAFLGGALWQFVQAREARLERDTARQELVAVEQQRALEQLEASLALATVAAQFGDFESSRRLASDFFGKLQDEVGRVPEVVRPGLNEILARRDGVITVLSRAEPESALELAALLTALQEALGKDPILREDLRSDSTSATRS